MEQNGEDSPMTPGEDAEESKSEDEATIMEQVLFKAKIVK